MEFLLEKLGVGLNYTQELLIAALMMSRTVTLVLFTPWLGGKLIPPEIKMGVSVLLVVLLWPLARSSMTDPIPTQALPYVLLMCKEVLIGFVLGFIASKIFWAAEVAGRLSDTVRGASMAEVMVPQSGERATPIGDLYYQLLIVLFLAVGGHRIFIEAYFWSFKTIPIEKSLDFGPRLIPFFEHMVRVGVDVLLLGTMLAAPVIAATFITDLVFGILNRVAPTLNAYFMAMPVKAMAGVVLIMVALQPIVLKFQTFIVDSLGHMEKAIDLMHVVR